MYSGEPVRSMTFLNSSACGVGSLVTEAQPEMATAELTARAIKVLLRVMSFSLVKGLNVV
jgi:hypothetical protein